MHQSLDAAYTQLGSIVFTRHENRSELFIINNKV